MQSKVKSSALTIVIRESLTKISVRETNGGIEDYTSNARINR